MTVEDIKKYIQKGCKVKFGVDPKEYEVIDKSNAGVYLKGLNTFFSYTNINNIISWPIPQLFTEDHIGHYVQVHDLSWKQIGKSLEDCKPGENKLTLFQANRVYIEAYQPIPPELYRLEKKTLLKDIPVMSFVKLNTKEKRSTSWQCIISKSTSDTIVLAPDSGVNNYVDPESEVIDVISTLEDIPKHAILRKRNSNNWTTLSEFLKGYGKFQDIAAISTGPAVNGFNKPKPVETPEHSNILEKNMFFFKDNYWWKITEIIENQDNVYASNSEGHSIWFDAAEVRLAKKVIQDWTDLPKNNYYVKIKGTWSKYSVPIMIGYAFNEIEAISETKPLDFDLCFQDNSNVISEQQWNSIKPGWWVKIANKDYIKFKLDSKGKYKGRLYNRYQNKEDYFGKWTQTYIRDTHNPDQIIAVGKENNARYLFHKDFIVDMSSTGPKGINSWEIRGAIADGIPCEEIPLGDPKECVLQDWSCYTLITEEMRKSIELRKQQENKIMLNTKEEIKDANLDSDLLNKAALKTKEIREERITKQVQARQQELLNDLDALGEDKKRIDKMISEKEELLKALGYPPK